MVGEDHADALLSWQLMNMDTACTGHTRHHLEGMECAIDIVGPPLPRTPLALRLARRSTLGVRNGVT